MPPLFNRPARLSLDPSSLLRQPGPVPLTRVVVTVTTTQANLIVSSEVSIPEVAWVGGEMALLVATVADNQAVGVPETPEALTVAAVVAPNVVVEAAVGVSLLMVVEVAVVVAALRQFAFADRAGTNLFQVIAPHVVLVASGGRTSQLWLLLMR